MDAHESPLVPVGLEFALPLLLRALPAMVTLATHKTPTTAVATTLDEFGFPMARAVESLWASLAKAPYVRPWLNT